MMECTRRWDLEQLVSLKSDEESWWALTGSNRRHSACKADALPTELSAPKLLQEEL